MCLYRLLLTLTHFRGLYLETTYTELRGGLQFSFLKITPSKDTSYKCSGKYLGSPLYRGSILWDELEKSTQYLPNVREFTKVLTKKCRVYKDLLHRY